MDIMKKLFEDLKLRIGYKEEVTITKEELDLIINGDLNHIKQLEEQIEDLESDIEDMQDCEEENEELKSKIERITNIVNE